MLARRVGAQADLLLDSVASGASVNFMAGLGHDAAMAFWRARLPDITAGSTHLFAAEAEGRLLGVVLLFFAQQPNAPHRADIGKMLVHSAARRQGLGRRLLTAAETAAREVGRTLLLLGTESGSAGDKLYCRCGWVQVGAVPGHAHKPDGRLAETTVFYKVFGPHRSPMDG